MRVKPKLPNLSGFTDPAFHISSAEWNEIETAYGWQIPIDAREQIRAKTNTYVMHAEQESNREAFTKSEAVLSALSLAAEQVRRALTELHGCSDAAAYAKRLVKAALTCEKTGADNVAGIVQAPAPPRLVRCSSS